MDKIDKKELKLLLERVASGELSPDMCLANFTEVVLENAHEVKQRREQILDINQWSQILLSNRKNIRDRVLWAMISDINNRTTD